MNVTNDTGYICPICQLSIKQNEYYCSCPKCGKVHHEHCWNLYGGCVNGCDKQGQNNFVEMMYANIGKKIKSLAVWGFIVEAIGSILFGIYLSTEGIDTGLVDSGLFGILMLFLGPIVAFVSSLILYGYGEIIDKVSNIENHLRDK